MKPHAAENPRDLTRKQRVHMRRDDVQRRWVVLVTSLILFIVLAIVGAGLLDQFVLKQRQPVAIVGGEKITTHQFQVAVRYKRFQLIGQYNQTLQFASFLGGDPSTDSYIQQQLASIQTQLSDNESLGQTVLEALVSDHLIRQEAVRRGIVVTSDEVERELHDAFGFYPEGTPTLAGPTLTPRPPTVIPAVSPTPTVTLTPTATPATPEPSRTPVPTSTPYTAEAFATDYQTYLSETRTATGMNEAEFREVIESVIYRRKLQAALTADLPRQEDQVHARHILVATQAEAAALRDRLMKGEAWDALAKEASLDTSNKDSGGDLGWFGRGQMVGEFEAAAFALKPGSISEPVQTTFGWHLINVVSHQVRTLSLTAYEDLQNSFFENWLAGEGAKTGAVETFEIWKERVPTEPVLPTA
ncbi:MAG: peptidylprolyl isomerase [Chloroflexi bacterium]|nr:peptidylprolyl isomerase [Chloroflexota bacterium]